MKKLKCSEGLEQILQKFDMPAYPNLAVDKDVAYTDYLTGAHDETFNTDPTRSKGKREYVYTPDRNRQCSIGWHTECSLTGCGCVCHEIMKLLR